MQKEASLTGDEVFGEDDTQKATSKTDNTLSDGSLGTDDQSTVTTPKDETDAQANSENQFEELIKGPYKDAFAKKVQGIINKRFKEQKTAEQKINDAEKGAAENKSHLDKEAEGDEKQSSSTDDVKHLKSDANNTLDLLLNAGIDADTAYKVIHLDELLDSSARYGAQMAAKSIADGLRLKSARPTENGIRSSGGLAPGNGAAALTPEKRRELAHKALMGDKIGFN